MTLRVVAFLCSVVALIIGVMAEPNGAAAATPTCGSLAAYPSHGLAGNPFIKSVTSSIATTAAPASVSYCLVTLVWGTPGTQENITIAVGLPLNPSDGGSRGLIGAWNGRTEGLGGGVCTGTLNVDAAVNAGYVGSGTDGGHPISPSAAIGDCATWVKADGSYDIQHIEDFFRIGIKQEILFSKAIAKAYYDHAPTYNYWNGCSTGGRQGYLLAQELGEELDGVLANAPAMYWTRFATAQAWGEIAMFDQAGESPPGAIPPAKLAAVRQSAIAACDGNDGVLDGIIDDPRTCHFDASANICGRPKAPAAPICLTSAEALAVNLIWDGPRNTHGNRIWYGLDRGTDFAGLDGLGVFPFVQIQFEWNEKDQSYAYPLVGPGLFPTSQRWNTVTLTGANNTLSYAKVAQDGSRNIADVTDTFGPLDTFRAHGGKMLTFVGTNDQLIYPRGVINYYRQMAERYETHHGQSEFEGVQGFYRLFRAPGIGHCGGEGYGVWPQNGADFTALVNWVENGTAPEQVIGATATGQTPALTRPLCPYPQSAKYKGTGSIHDAANWACGGNVDTPQVACADVRVKYKDEVDGPLDHQQSGVDPDICRRGDRVADDEHDHDHHHDGDH